MAAVQQEEPLAAPGPRLLAREERVHRVVMRGRAIEGWRPVAPAMVGCSGPLEGGIHRATEPARALSPRE